MKRIGLSLLFAVVAAACSTTNEDAPGGSDGGVPTGNPNGADNGGGCTKGFDCKSGVCTGGACAAPTSSDGVKNGDETDLDCGGSSAPKCVGGKACKIPNDCASGACNNNVCGPSSPNDGVKNGDETDIDCGGVVAPACAPEVYV